MPAGNARDKNILFLKISTISVHEVDGITFFFPFFSAGHARHRKLLQAEAQEAV
jgi:hypothetical protein